MPRRMNQALAVLVAALITAGCSIATEELPLEDQTSLNDEVPLEQEAESSPAPSLEQPSADEGSTLQLQSCGPEEQGSIEAVIELQTELFSQGDFEQAHSLASEAFQSGVSVEAFAELIVRDYSALVTASELGFSGCLLDPDRAVASIAVSVSTPENRVFNLSYVLQQQDSFWRIDGASNLTEVGVGA